MKNFLVLLLFAATSIVLYKINRPLPSHLPKKWLISDETPIFIRSGKNCTFASCYDTSRCVLNSSHVTFYIQPLVEFVDKNGTVISPAPSREFLEIRRYLSSFSVSDPAEACLSLPGVDFLNFDRFHKEDDILKIVAVLKTRLQNMIIINFLGKVPSLDVALISSLPGRDQYRPEFDMSIPLLVSGSGETITEKTDLLLIPLIHVSGAQKQKVFKELGETKATLISECQPSKNKICFENGQEADLEKLIQSNKFVLLLCSSPLFPRLLSLSLKAGSVPIIYGDSVILPFQNHLDWSSYSLMPWSLTRIPHILGRLTQDDIELRVRKGHDLYQKMFSSTEALMENVVAELGSRILPYVGDRKDTCTPLLPHLVHSTDPCGLVIGHDSSIVRTVNRLCSSSQLRKVSVLWTSPEQPPSFSEWNCRSTPVEVVYGAGESAASSVTKMSTACSSYLFVPLRACEVKKVHLVQAVDMWLSVPHTLVHLPKTNSCRPAVLLHSTYLSNCQPEQLDRNILPSIYLSDQATDQDLATVLV